MATSVSTTNVPEPVARIAGVMAGYPGDWVLCGGWAVEAWTGRTVREHGDIDIAVFQDELGLLFEHLDGWQLVAHDPNGDEPRQWDGRRIDLPGHLHGRLDTGEPLPTEPILRTEDGFTLDIQVCERSAGEWLLCREPPVTLALRQAIVESPWGLPALVPEGLLFYKADDPRRRDKIDFLALRSHLTPEQREWLRDALSRLGHPWLSRLPA